ncbi:OB-fold domain-containing protein [Nocardioides sp. TF02-7]|uniref:Zn-ribbon domain-containing OB-fold protein n=1 Tax=Nocardioides sp. TF02-7 TaxID=2917724 RepID=UPI001F05C5F9|nr:OB-fold domain-containing protein [Nocardioides sp. TF02-7]UMG91286.1 OB-fold domain-containing protein [Nocardioides sp. TF02-7]
MRAVPVAEELFTWPADQPRLVGGRCERCGVLTFPAGGGCPACGSDTVTSTLLEPEGTLWSWTSQEFLPKEPYLGATDPDSFEPWYVGLVELGGEIRVEGRLTGCDASTLRIGQRMRTVVVPFARRGDEDVLTFAFAPVGEEQADG